MSNVLPGFNVEYQKLLEEYENLKEALAEQSEDLEYMVTQQDKLLRVEYVEKIGNLEYEDYELSIQIARIRRKIALIQAAVNRKEKIDLEAIDARLDDEYIEYVQKLMEMAKERDAAMKQKEIGLMDENDSKYLSKTYKELVKKLHPDIIGKQTKKQETLWLQLLQAYADSDIDAIRNIAVIMETFDDGIQTEEGVETIMRRISQMSASIDRIKKEKNELMKLFPFNKIEFLKDKKAVKEMRGRINEHIESQKEALKGYRIRLKELKENCIE